MKLKYKNNILHLLCLSLLFSFSCKAQTRLNIKPYNSVTCGSQQFSNYLPLLKNKRVGIVTNISGMVGKTTIVDTLISLNVKVIKIFGPEHGFRSDTEAGEKVQNNKDKKTGLPVVSLYGSNKKPTKEQLQDIDILVYDIQDIGVRFYTYISTLCYVMEACAESGKELIVLDRPNPNGFYVDGPVLKSEFKSFLGLHPVPLVYGMTTAEYASMANGEGWLKDRVKCKLHLIKMQNYDRRASYKLPVKPSPNIPNSTAVLLYPGMGLFEGTIVSLGRGTNFPFQVLGHPAYSDTSFSFTPKPTALAKEPKYVNKRCFGIDLRKDNYVVNHPKKIDLRYLKIMYNNLKGNDFFDKNFNFHAGNAELQAQVKAGMSEEGIRKSWQADLDAFKVIRKKYLLYTDF